MQKHNRHHPNGFDKLRLKQKTSLIKSLPASKQRALRRNLLFIGATVGAMVLLGLLSNAYAAGGSYVVDDGGINAPGECNVDTWYTAHRHQASTYNGTVSAACTLAALPLVQWGAAVQRSHSDDQGQTQVSPQLKAQVFSQEDLGLKMAVSAAAHFALNRAHSYDGVDLSVPLTWQPLDALRFNVNGGWTHAYDDGDQQHHLTWGTGVEYDAFDAMTLIVERYGQRGGDQAWQAGPRLHVGKALDVDLVVGRSLIGDRDQWFTTGATLRF